jgi:cell division control protein 6
VLDEMDQLDSKHQEILYTIFEWPSLDRSRLVLIGIANALDLTDRILPRLQARPKCKPQLLHFPPYSRDQIVQVLQERLRNVSISLVKDLIILNVHITVTMDISGFLLCQEV